MLELSSGKIEEPKSSLESQRNAVRFLLLAKVVLQDLACEKEVWVAHFRMVSWGLAHLSWFLPTWERRLLLPAALLV